MPVVVVGGSGRGVGKTALVCGLIAALPEFSWTAIKITTHAHGANGTIQDERDAGDGTDTGRYLAAGAQRAFLVAATDEALVGVVRELWGWVDRAAPLIFESNRIVDYCRPDICLAVDAKEAAHKPSFARLAGRADVWVMRSEVNRVETQDRTIYHLAEMDRISPELLAWMRSRMVALSKQKMGM